MKNLATNDKVLKAVVGRDQTGWHGSAYQLSIRIRLMPLAQKMKGLRRNKRCNEILMLVSKKSFKCLNGISLRISPWLKHDKTF